MWMEPGVVQLGTCNHADALGHCLGYGHPNACIAIMTIAVIRMMVHLRVNSLIRRIVSAILPVIAIIMLGSQGRLLIRWIRLCAAVAMVTLTAFRQRVDSVGGQPVGGAM